MRTLKTTLAALGLAVMIASPAWAQRGGRGGFGGPGMLLGNKSVQEELKVDEAQAGKLKDLAENYRTKATEARESTSGIEGQERFQKLQELMKPINEETMKSLGSVLKPEQMKRFHQITLQQQGAQAFASPETQADLKLTDDQKDKVKTILEESRASATEIRKNAGDDRAAAQEKSTALRKETMEKVMALLNDDQKKTWQEKTGAPFTIVREPRQNNN